MYRIVLDSRPGVYFLLEVLDPALNNYYVGPTLELRMSMAGVRSYFSKLTKKIVVR